MAKDYYVTGGRKRIRIRQFSDPISGDGKSTPWVWARAEWFNLGQFDDGRIVEVQATDETTAHRIFADYCNGKR